MRTLKLVVPLSLLWLVAAPAGAVTLISVERIVSAASAANLFLAASDKDDASESSTETGGFLEAAVTADTIGDLAQARAESLQDSTVLLSAGGALIAYGAGSVVAGVDVFDPGFASLAQLRRGCD